MRQFPSDCGRVIAEMLAGDSLSMPQAARLIPAQRGKAATVNSATVWRWAVDGCRTADGSGRVRLEVCRVGCRWATSRAALARFLAALSGDADPAPVVAPGPVPAPPEAGRISAARRQALAADLDSLGL